MEKILPKEFFFARTETRSLSTIPERVVAGRLASGVSPPQVIVEIGTHEGGMAALMRRFAPDTEIFSIDPSPKDSAFQVARECGITLVREFSARASRKFERDIGLLIIDGSHVFEDVLDDWTLWSPKCANSWVAFHDYQPSCPGIICLVDTLIENKSITDCKIIDSLVWGRISRGISPTKSQLEKTMDVLALKYLELARCLANMQGDAQDARSGLFPPALPSPATVRIVGNDTGLMEEAAGKLGLGRDSFAESGAGPDPEALYIFVDIDRQKAINQLEGIHESSIIDIDTALKIFSDLPGRARQEQVETGPLSRMLISKIREAFRDNRHLLECFGFMCGSQDVATNKLYPMFPPIG